MKLLESGMSRDTAGTFDQSMELSINLPLELYSHDSGDHSMGSDLCHLFPIHQNNKKLFDCLFFTITLQSPYQKFITEWEDKFIWRAGGKKTILQK